MFELGISYVKSMCCDMKNVIQFFSFVNKIYLRLFQFSDNYYRAALVEAVSKTVTPAITLMSTPG